MPLAKGKLAVNGETVKYEGMNDCQVWICTNGTYSVGFFKSRTEAEEWIESKIQSSKWFVQLCIIERTNGWELK